MHISPIVIGLIVFGFGTSAPEILVSIFAAINNNNGIAVGNAIGSNIINITLVLAISSIIYTIKFSNNNLKVEYSFLLIITIILGILIYDNYLSRTDGMILILAFIVFLFIILKNSKKQLIHTPHINNKDSIIKILFILLINLIILLISAKLVVYSASNIAKILGISDLIIGLTVISLGTSLPELALAISSSIKKQHQMLIGNILGSNIFNSTIVLSTVAIINPQAIDEKIFSRDYLWALTATLLIFVLAYRYNQNKQINRLGGIILLIVLGFYLYILSQSA